MRRRRGLLSGLPASSSVLNRSRWLTHLRQILGSLPVGDHQYFAREDSVEETWRIVQPLLDHPPDVRPYPCGSWGPEEAEALVRGHPRWQQPWLPTES